MGLSIKDKIEMKWNVYLSICFGHKFKRRRIAAVNLNGSHNDASLISLTLILSQIRDFMKTIHITSLIMLMFSRPQFFFAKMFYTFTTKKLNFLWVKQVFAATTLNEQWYFRQQHMSVWNHTVTQILFYKCITSLDHHFNEKWWQSPC